jgi:hypothetical protein
MRGIVVVGLLVGCAQTDVQTVSQSIVNGELDTGDPATVYLDLGGGGCSGTLVSKKTVVTARHCLSSQMYAFFGTDRDDEGTWLKVTHKLGHDDGDIAMLTLEDVGPADPFPLTTANLAEHTGQPIRIAGFGVTSENGGGDGTKRVGMAMLVSVEGDIMYATNEPSGTCYGDSGGPNFMMIGAKEYLIGVTSFGTAACGSGQDGSVRIDTYLQWVKDYIVEHDELPVEPTCDADNLCATGCPAVDPDCPCATDGFCDAACGDIGTDADCAGCLAGDTCRMDCPVLDSDCCSADGTCTDACGDTDPDCGDGDGDGDGDGSGGGDDGGCAAGGGAGLASALVLLVLARRRRR